MNSTIITLLAQEGGRIPLNTESLEGDFKGFDINFGKSWVTAAQVIAGIVAIVWVFFAIFKFMAPSGRAGGGSGLQRIGGAAPLIIAIICIALLVNINKTADIINGVLIFGSGILGLILGALPEP